VSFNHFTSSSSRLEHLVFAAMASFKIRIPCSSANLGPGFDVMGLALTLFLELQVTIDPSDSQNAPLNCIITYAGSPESTKDIPREPDANLITQTALYVLRCHGQRMFPPGTKVHVDNPIPLGRGLGSSAAAVVAGAVLGNEVGKLNLDKARLLDYCLMIGKFLPGKPTPRL
jgi:homoserine kinase